jgi:hypothetical protein
MLALKSDFGVMAGLVPAIHVFVADPSSRLDARDKRGHDNAEISARAPILP